MILFCFFEVVFHFFSDSLLCHSQLELRLSWAVTTHGNIQGRRVKSLPVKLFRVKVFSRKSEGHVLTRHIDVDIQTSLAIFRLQLDMLDLAATAFSCKENYSRIITSISNLPSTSRSIVFDPFSPEWFLTRQV